MTTNRDIAARQHVATALAQLRAEVLQARAPYKPPAALRALAR